MNGKLSKAVVEFWRSMLLQQFSLQELTAQYARKFERKPPQYFSLTGKQHDWIFYHTSPLKSNRSKAVEKMKPKASDKFFSLKSIQDECFTLQLPPTFIFTVLETACWNSTCYDVITKLLYEERNNVMCASWREAQKEWDLYMSCCENDCFPSSDVEIEITSLLHCSIDETERTLW